MGRREGHRERLAREYDARAECGSPSREGIGFDPIQQARAIGYTDTQLERVPPGSVMGRGGGNPIAAAELQPGETVLDVGCGGGLDAFLAAQVVGDRGKVIGVDPTPQMVEKARDNARHGEYGNVVFERGEVEHLPVGDDSVDVVISNCVLNHCLDKVTAFGEIRRVLKPGGRMCITDLVTLGEFSQETLDDPLWGTWLATASGRREYLDAIKKVGFEEVLVFSAGLFGMAEADERLSGKIESICVTARK